MSGKLPKALRTLSRDQIEYDGMKRKISLQEQEIKEYHIRNRQKNEEIGDLRLQRYNLEQLVISLRADRNQMQDRIIRQHRQLRILEEDFQNFKRNYDDLTEELKKCQDIMMKTGEEMLKMAEELTVCKDRLTQNENDFHGH